MKVKIHPQKYCFVTENGEEIEDLYITSIDLAVGCPPEIQITVDIANQDIFYDKEPVKSKNLYKDLVKILKENDE